MFQARGDGDGEFADELDVEYEKVRSGGCSESIWPEQCEK